MIKLEDLKRFTWVPLPRFDDATTAHTDYTHLYKTPRGDIFKSVTTMLYKVEGTSPGIERWKVSVGEQVAKHITEESKRIGTATHEIIEQYLNNEKPSELALLVRGHFTQLKELLDNIDEIFATEQILYSYDMSLAGTADCIAKYKGIESIIDFKTSKKKKKEEWIENYFLQATIYARMWHELTGRIIKKIVILISCEDGTVQEFVKSPIDYEGVVDEKLKKFREMGGFES